MSQYRFKNGDLLADRYLVKSYLAAGGMQEVYVCEDTALSRIVVVKTPKNGVVDRRFRRGAEMGARVVHSNVAATLDYFEDDKLTFMVEEFVSGKDLGERLRTEFAYMDPSLAAHVLHHIARALFEAHRVGICHRDLKPSNVMTSDDASISTIKLTDFGIAKLAEAELAAEIERFGYDNTTLTSSATLLGAVPYLAPECWQNWASAGQPMDIWALGCVGYQLLTGAPPFGVGPSAIGAVIGAHQRGSVTLALPAWFGRHTYTARLEQELMDVINKCIDVNPNSRPNAQEVLSMLDSLCYANSVRMTGVISEYGIVYGNGSVSQTGNIRDSSEGAPWFFHFSDFFGDVSPAPGQRVSFSVYPGVPRPRSSPVLLLK